MKKFYTAIDIENKVKSGQKALILGPNELLTPLARDRARELGLHLRSEPERPSASAAAPAPVAATQTSGLAADALNAFRSLLQQAREEAASTPYLAQCFDDLLRAAEQGDALHPHIAPQRADLSPERQQALVAQAEKMTALACYLFGPDSSHRRYDILWALAILKTHLKN